MPKNRIENPDGMQKNRIKNPAIMEKGDFAFTYDTITELTTTVTDMIFESRVGGHDKMWQVSSTDANGEPDGYELRDELKDAWWELLGEVESILFGALEIELGDNVHNDYVWTGK